MSNVDETMLPDVPQGAECQHLFVQEENGWRFVLPEMIFFVQAINVAGGLQLNLRPDEETLQELSSLAYTKSKGNHAAFKSYQVLVDFILAWLINECGRSDLLGLIVSRGTTNETFWQLHEAVSHALPILDLREEQLAEFLPRLAERVQGDLFQGEVYSATTQIGQLRPATALHVIDLLTVTQNQSVIGLVVALLIGVAESSAEGLQAIICRCQDGLTSGNEFVAQTSVYCLKDLALGNRFPPDRLLSRIASIVPEAGPHLRYAFVATVTALGGVLPALAEESCRLAAELKDQGPVEEIAYGIAAALVSSAGRHSPDYLVSCLALLTDVSPESKGTIARIRSLLSVLGSARPAAVWEYLHKWILAHDGNQIVVSDDLFITPIHTTFERDPALGTKTLTAWFVSEDSRLVKQARFVVDELKVQSFDAQEVRTMSRQKVLYATEKLLAGVLDGPQILNLLYSILANTTRFAELEDYFERTVSYLARNYPGSTKEFLSHAAAEKISQVAALLQRVHQQLDDYEIRRKGTAVPELAPSRRRAEKYLAFESKKFRSAQEAVLSSGHSPLLEMISRVVIGRGDRTFHMNIYANAADRRTFSQPSGFGEFTQSIELPRIAVIDPEGEAWIRLQRLSCTLADFEDKDG